MAISRKEELVKLFMVFAERVLPWRASAMCGSELLSVAAHFEELEDPRVARTRRHPLVNVVVIGICAVICGAQHFTEMEEFGKKKKAWLARFLDLTNGIPSHDTFNAVFALLKPEQFERCLLSWIMSLVEVTEGQILAIDGKTLRGSYNTGDSRAAIHMVSVWATVNHVSLGSLVVDEKSNEITAIPRLLELIDISGALVTIDAMGCQKEIARKIVQEGGDYVLAVKDNQPKLHEAIGQFFDEQLEEDFAHTPCRKYEAQEEGHGRVEQRYYFLTPVPEDFAVRGQWHQLKALGLAINITEREGKETSEVRYFILSKYVSGKRFAQAVRSHWSIENNLHWQLDVTFREDDLRIREGHAPANMSILMRTALALLKQEKTLRRGISTKRLVAGWNEDYLEKVLTSH
jgi:predicted transposase YbfD/YdcC